jgi:thiamine biosynthesis lipoprotein
MPAWRLALPVPLLALLCTAASARATLVQKIEASRMSMGCLYSVAAYAADRERARHALERALDEVDRIDRLMSHYRDDSPLSSINRRAAREPVVVEPELFDFLEAAFAYGRESDGAFDVTVGPLMKAWGFFRGEGRVPTPPELARARAAVGLRHVLVDNGARTVRFDRDGVELDLGGIAKGYAVDRAVAILRRDGIDRALVSACGSTVYGLGSPPDGTRWTVDVEDPLDARKIAFTVPLTDRALSISGISAKSFEHEGVRYSHIMDPRTGYPVRGVLAVIVQAPTGTAGDAIDNVLFVQGPTRGRAFLRRHPGVDAVYLIPDRARGWTRMEGR